MIRRGSAPGRRRIVGIGLPFEDAEKDRRVGDAPGHRAGCVLIGCDGDDAVSADAADRRLHGGKHVGVCRTEDRSGRLRADVGSPEACRRAGAGARSAGVQRRPSVEGRLPRIAPWIIWIEPIAVQRVVVVRHRRRRSGHPVGQLGHLRLGHDDGPAVAEIFRHRRFVGRHEAVEDERATGGGHVGGLDVVLDGDRNAVQRPADVSLLALAIALVGLFERIGVHGDRRVQLVLIRGDAREALQHELSRGDPSGPQRLLHLRNGRFDDAEWLVLR